MEDRQQFSHAGDQRHLGRLPSGPEARVEDADHRVMAGGHERAHVERRTDRGAAAPDHALAPPRAAVAGARRHPDQGGDLLVGQGAQLGQLAQERATDPGADPGDGPQEILLGPPERTAAKGLVEVAVHVHELALEPADVLRDAPAHGRGGKAEPVLFGRQHLEQLPAPHPSSAVTVGCGGSLSPARCQPCAGAAATSSIPALCSGLPARRAADALVGHKTESMYLRYRITNLDETRVALAKQHQPQVAKSETPITVEAALKALADAGITSIEPVLAERGWK